MSAVRTTLRTTEGRAAPVSEPVRLLALGAIPWIRTQAIYHALAELMTEDAPDTLILARTQEPYVCVGYHQPLRAVLDRATCRGAGLPIVRRRVGGGTTYLDKNQQFYQCIFHHKRLPFRVDEVYARLLGAPVAVLRKLGLQADLRDGNEIEVDGRRIAGVGGGRIGEAMVVVGNILLDFDFEMMARVWRVPSEDFRRLAYEAMQRHITTLWSRLPQPISTDEVQARLAEEYSVALNRPVVPGSLTEAEQAKAVVMEKQLISEEWLDLHAESKDEPMRKLKISLNAFVHAEEARMNGIVISGTFFARDGVIEQAILTSDLPEKKGHRLEERLIGVPLKYWRDVLEPLAVIS
jgi:lipoate---protein ligase